MREKEFNPLDPRAQAAAEKATAEASKFDREQEIEDFKYLMEQPQGRRFIWRLLERSGVFRTSFSLNGLEMAFREGNRNLGTYYIAELNEHCPNRYVQMIKERKQAHEHRSGKRQPN